LNVFHFFFVQPKKKIFLGITLRDLTFIEEGNQDFIEDDHVNFEKLMILGGVILEVQRYQKKAYTMQVDKRLETNLKKLVVFPEEVLYKHSLRAEPKDA
jgi:hypothetical protein